MTCHHELLDNTLGHLYTPARNNYFYGKLLDECHLTLEQNYFNRKRWLLNQFSLGYGVLCGLDVIEDPKNSENLVIKKGIAIDKLGREIVVPKQSKSLDPHQLTDDCGKATHKDLDADETAWICLAFHECPSELVPVMVGECEREKDCAPSIICERYKILVLAEKSIEFPPSCYQANWLQTTKGGILEDEKYQELIKRVSQLCPEVNDQSCVPLARITYQNGVRKIDLSVRPIVFSNDDLFRLMLCITNQEVKPPQDNKLPVINEMSWRDSENNNNKVTLKHGQEIKHDEFAKILASGLTIHFSEKIEDSSEHGRAIFVITLEKPSDEEGIIEVIHILEKEVIFAEKTITFIASTSFVNNNLRSDSLLFSGMKSDDALLCRVVLKCNFIKKKNGGLKKEASADGDFFGEFPSGDEIPGGDFETWFFVGRNDERRPN